MLNKVNIQLFYQYFYQRRYNNLTYRFEPSETANKQIKKFIELLDKRYRVQTLGLNFLWHYFTFQFDYWDELEIQSFSKRIVLTYIIGEKALQRYLERNTEYDWQIEDSRILEKYNLRKVELFNSIQTIDHSGIVEGEIKIKELAHNTDKGFNNCLIFTSLYNHKHYPCITCNYKQDCKKLLELNFTKLYEQRGYTKKKSENITI